VPVEDLDDLREVGERAGEPVDLVDHYNVDDAGLDVGEELLQPPGRSIEPPEKPPSS
jgi:hypothetical protein